MPKPKLVLAVAASAKSDKLLVDCKAPSALMPCAAVAKTVASCKAVSANAPWAAVA